MADKGKKAIVISGGGSKGAFAGGICEYLVKNLEKDYDIYLGSSTGSLLVPLLALGRINKLKIGYTNVRQSDIFTLSPFKVVQNKNGVTKIEMDYWNVFKNIIIRKKRTFGDSSNLRKYIETFISNETYKELLLLDKEVITCVSNVTLGQKEFKCNKNYEWQDYLDWTYASACAPPFMSLVEKDGYEYTDGAIMEYAPIQEAINRGATEVDVILLRPEHNEHHISKIRNAFHWVIKIMEIQHKELNREGIQLPKLKVLDGDVTVNIYYTPRVLTNNELIFDKEIMADWWTEGIECAKQSQFKSYLLVKGRKPKLIKKEEKKEDKD